MQTQPRIIRVSKAHLYLGMCREVFTKDIRPHLTEYRVGIRGKGFERTELDEVADRYMEANIIRYPAGEKPCRKDSTNVRIRPIGMSTKHTEASALQAALAQARGKKPKTG